ncbi:partial perosamine synthetase, partial [Candidatus Brocadiaceae bacterium]
MSHSQIPAILGGPQVIADPPPHFQWPLIENRDEAAIVRQLNTAVSVYGRQGIIKEFEDSFLDYLNKTAVKKITYALATNNGTSALHAAYFGCGLGPGDEVIVPAYAFHATATPILHCNAVPVFCDVDPSNGNINIQDASSKITERTKAVVVTHLWGHPAEMDQISNLCNQRGLYLIEDCSHAHGATYHGSQVGTFGDVACFSLQGTKMLTAGEGGIVVTDNLEIYERANLLADSRSRPSEEIKTPKYRRLIPTGFGLKFRIHPLGAALVCEQLKRLDQWIAWRKAQLEYLTDGLREIESIETPSTSADVTRGAFFGYECLFSGDLTIRERELYIAALRAEGLE